MRQQRAAYFAVITVLGALTLMIAALCWLEHRAREAVQNTGWNIRGYRGKVLGRKALNELRVFALGASTTYGYGVPVMDAYPAQLERRLREAHPLPGRQVTVVNLGMMAEPGNCLQANLRDYAYLKPDMIIMYAGYNGARDDEQGCRRQSSPVFRLFKIMPIFPTVVREKWYRLRYGSVAEGYIRYRKARGETYIPLEPGDEPQIPLTPDQRRLVETLGEEAGSLEPFRAFEEDYRRYERTMADLINATLAKSLPVLFVFQVDVGRGEHQYQQHRIRKALERYKGEPNFLTADAGRLFGGQVSQEYFATWMHLNARGNDRLAGMLVEPVSELLAARVRQQSVAGGR